MEYSENFVLPEEFMQHRLAEQSFTCEVSFRRFRMDPLCGIHFFIVSSSLCIHIQGTVSMSIRECY